MDHRLRKELELQGIQQFSSLLMNKMRIENQSIVDDCIRHITIAGATFFNKCWSISVLLSRLLEFERQAMDKEHIRHLPHPLFLLLHNEPETYKYTLAVKKTINVPQDEYKRLYDELEKTGGSYKLPTYNIARSYITILLELVRLFIIHIPVTPRTKLFTYDKDTDCVSFQLLCSRHGTFRHYQDLLDLNLHLEEKLSNIFGNCTYNKFKRRPKDVTLETFMSATFFNQRTNNQGTGDNDKLNQITGKESLPTTDSSDNSSEEVRQISGNKSDSVTSPKVTPHNSEEENHIEESLSGNTHQEETSNDNVSENQSDTDNSHISSNQMSTENTTVSGNNNTDQTDSIISTNNDVQESSNKDNNNVGPTNNDTGVDSVNNTTNNDNNQVDNTSTGNGIVEAGKAILLLGMSTVDVQETVKTYRRGNITDECSTTMASDCVVNQLISTTDGRDLARINSIKCYDKSNVYTVSLVNTNPFLDTSSNPTVYDSDRHLNADYNCRHFVSSLESMLGVGNQKVQFQEIAVDYYYMPAVSFNGSN